MTPERAQEFGEAWNSGDPAFVASFFAEDGVYHASVGAERLGATYVGRAAIRRGVQAFFDRFPDGRFENLRVVVAGASAPSNGTSSRPGRTARSRGRPAATCSPSTAIWSR